MTRIRLTEYFRVGSASVPSNITAGDLTATRLFLGASQTHLESGGLLTAAALANRTRHIWIPADNSWSIAFGTPALALRGSAAAPDKMTTWAFDAAANEYISTNFMLPADWDGGAITIRVYWAGDGAGGPAANEVLWQVFTAGIAAGNQIDTAVENSPTVLGSVAIYEALVISTFASYTPDAPLLRVILARIGADASDDYNADAWFVGLLIEYTSDS